MAGQSWDDIWWDAWPPVSSPSILAQLTVEELQEISHQLKDQCMGCQKPKLARFSYSNHGEQAGWAAYRMPITPEQADALFCEFMPDPNDERAWLAGSNDVRVVEVGWTPFACAIMRTLYKPTTTHVPTIWEMAWDLAMCGIGSKAAFDGVYQHPSSWILDTIFAILA
eukprot:1941118-Amphidinium_carterae.2